MKIHLFYNGNSGRIPGDSNAWTEYQDPDSFKLAWVCAESWKRQGWEVERMRCCSATLFSGRLAKSKYPFNDFLFRLERLLAPTPGGHIWFTTSDVINFGFSTKEAALLPSDKHIIPNASFTMACGRVSYASIKEMIDLLWLYDNGQIAEIDGLQADEHILRRATNYPERCSYHDLMGCPTSTLRNPLVHYSRSTLQWFPETNF